MKWVWIAAVALALAGPAAAENGRLALVVGNAAYSGGALPTALNDAGLVADSLRAIGFDVGEAANLGAADLSARFHDFVGKVEAAGPAATAVVYIAAYGFTLDGDDLLVGADARLERDVDIPLDTVRLSGLIRAMAATPARAKLMMIDATRPVPFEIEGYTLAPGLAALDAPSTLILGFSNAPGTAAKDGQGPYGSYAKAVAEGLRAPGLDLAEVFKRIRLRTHQLTQGTQTPWETSGLTTPVVLVPGMAGSPPRRPRPMHESGVDEAYGQAIEQDSMAAFEDFLTAFPRTAFTERILAMLQIRRQALAWRRAVALDNPPSYWTYLRRYPDGLYRADAERRLRRIAAAVTPPKDFVPVPFPDVPPLLPAERPAAIGFHAQSLPQRLIAPPPSQFVNLVPQAPAVGGVLPRPAIAIMRPRMSEGALPRPNQPPVGPGATTAGPPIAPAIRPAAASPTRPSPSVRAPARPGCKIENGVEICPR